MWSGLTRVDAVPGRQSHFQDTWWNIFWFVAEACLLSFGGSLAVHPWKPVLCGSSSLSPGRPLLSPIRSPGRGRGGFHRPSRGPSFCRAVFGTSVDLLHHLRSCSSSSLLYNPPSTKSSFISMRIIHHCGLCICDFETMRPGMTF